MKGLKIKKQFLVFCVGIVISFSCLAQDDSINSNNITPTVHIMMPLPAPSNEIFYKGSVEGGGGAIIPITNAAVRISLGGVYDVHFSGEYTVAPHLFIGLEVEDVQLGNTVQDAPYNTIMTMYNVGVKMGYYTYMQNDFLFCYSLSAGPSLIVFSDALIPAPRLTSFFITPDFLASYRINDELRVGVDLSYVLVGYKFDPNYVGITSLLPGSYNEAKDTRGFTSCIGLGFGLYWAFSEAKK
jgi:hypothetical protein